MDWVMSRVYLVVTVACRWLSPPSELLLILLNLQCCNNTSTQMVMVCFLWRESNLWAWDSSPYYSISECWVALWHSILERLLTINREFFSRKTGKTNILKFSFRYSKSYQNLSNLNDVYNSKDYSCTKINWEWSQDFLKSVRFSSLFWNADGLIGRTWYGLGVEQTVTECRSYPRIFAGCAVFMPSIYTIASVIIVES